MLYVAAIIVLGFYFEKWRSLATGISLCGAGIGCTIIPPLLTVILQRYGWRFTFLIQGLILIICGFCSLSFKPLKPIIIGTTSRGSFNSSKKEEENESLASKVKFNFFDRYHTTSFPTIIEMNSSTLTILMPEKMDRCESSVTVFETFQTKCTKKQLPLRASKVLSAVLESELEGSNGIKSNICYKFVKCCKCSKTRKKDITKKSYLIENVSLSQRPMYRDDIFYHGSMNLIPEYQRSMQSKTISTVN